MPRKDAEKADLEIAAAAYWRVVNADLSIQALSEKLDMNRNTLERRIRAAQEKDLISNDWMFRSVPPELEGVLSQMEDENLKNKILRLYGEKNVPELTVVPSWPPQSIASDEGDVENDKINMRIVAHAAAHVFVANVADMTWIGLSYGRTLREFIDKLEHLTPAVRQAAGEKKEPRTIVTIFGSLSFHIEDKRHGDWLDYSASHLTNRLARILGTKNCKRFFLETPVYVPPAFLDLFSEKGRAKGNLQRIIETYRLSEADALEIARAFVESIPTYHDVFKAEDAAIKKLDTLITSVGDLETGFGSFPKTGEVTKGEGKVAPPLREEEIDELTTKGVGDIAGRYVAAAGARGEKGSTIAKVNDRVFGITIEDLAGVAARAKEKETPGVIVIASSKKKARVVRALIDRQPSVISRLIISGDLAEELLSLQDE